MFQIIMKNEFSSHSVMLSAAETYELFLLLHTLDEMKRSFIMTLSQIYPKLITANELSLLSGYSIKSKYIFKSHVLDSMNQEGLIDIMTRGRKKYIQLNSGHSLL